MISLKKVLFSIAIFSYFTAMMLTTQIEGTVVALFWDASIVFSACMGLLSRKFKIEAPQLFILLVFFVTGVLNYSLVGNAQISHQVLICLYFFTALLFMDNTINEKLYLWLFILIVALIAYKFLTVGLYGKVFISSSTNFVSVYLLYPAVIYYSLLEERKSKIPIYPAVIIWIFSLLSRGRGGIIVTTFFLLGMLWISLHNSQRKRMLFLVSALIVLVGLIVINLDTILFVINNSVIMDYFNSRGLESIRLAIWAEYLDVVHDSLKNLLLGVRVQDTYYGVMFEGNFHNSFMNLHSLNGFFALFIVGAFAIRNLISSIKHRRYVFFLCLFTMLLRSVTDNVFWTCYGTPAVFFLLFYHNSKFKDVVNNRTKGINPKSFLN